MKLKKTWFGWLNFLIGTAFMSVSLFTLLVSLFEFNGFTTSLFGFAWLKSSFLISGAAIFIIVGSYLLIHFLKKNIHVKEGMFDTIGLPITWILFVIILGTGIFLRFSYLRNITSLDLFNQSAYEKIIYAFDGNKLSGLDIFSYLYYSFEALLLRIFGIKIIVPIVSNMVFQLIAYILLFVSAFVSFGKSSAILGFTFLMVFESSINNVLNISADSFTLFVASFVIMCISLSLRERRNGLMKSNSNIILFIIFASLLGLLVFVNPVFVIVPIYYVICILMQIKTDKMGEGLVEKKLTPIMLLFVGTIIAVVVFVAIECYLTGISFDTVFMTHADKVGFSDYLRIFYPAPYIIECVIIIAFCLIAYVSFIFKSYDNISAATFLFTLVYVAYAKNITSLNVSPVLLELFGIISGIGIKAYVFDDYTFDSKLVVNDSGAEKVEVTETIETETIETETISDETTETETTEPEIIEPESMDTDNAVTESEEVETGESESVETESIEAEFVKTESVEAESIGSEIKIVDNNDIELKDIILVNATQENESSECDDKVNMAQVVKTEIEKKEFVPIENVLPLPKKHVKKEIGYAFEPSPGEMKYDYEVNDDDDYDI